MLQYLIENVSVKNNFTWMFTNSFLKCEKYYWYFLSAFYVHVFFCLYSYVVSGHVQVVLSNSVDDKCPFIAMKSKVTPSQRARDKPHEPWVYLEKNSGTVYCAHCTCMAGYDTNEIKRQQTKVNQC